MQGFNCQLSKINKAYNLVNVSLLQTWTGLLESLVNANTGLRVDHGINFSCIKIVFHFVYFEKFEIAQAEN